MVMGFSAAFTQEPLEDVAETPGVMIGSIWATQMDTIKAITWRIPIEILLELCWMWMWGNPNMLLDIRVLKFISKNLIAILRQFTFKMSGISFFFIKSGGSVKNENIFNSRIS
jgi:hypothetical protein